MSTGRKGKSKILTVQEQNKILRKELGWSKPQCEATRRDINNYIWAIMNHMEVEDKDIRASAKVGDYVTLDMNFMDGWYPNVGQEGTMIKKTKHKINLRATKSLIDLMEAIDEERREDSDYDYLYGSKEYRESNNSIMPMDEYKEMKKNGKRKDGKE